MQTRVFTRGPANFDMCGKFLGYPLKEVDVEISPGLAKRLVAYASNRAKDAGLSAIVEGWEVEVYTMDGDDKPADRSYGVKWANPQGTEIELRQILTRGGWPVVDHRFSMAS